MNIGDTVVVKTEVLQGIVNPAMKADVAGSGIIVRNFDSGYFMVKFTPTQFWGGEHGFYGSDLIVVKKAQCQCTEPEVHPEIYVAPDGSV